MLMSSLDIDSSESGQQKWVRSGAKTVD